MPLLNQVNRNVHNYSWQSAEVWQSLSKCCTFRNSFYCTTLWDANCCWAPFIDEETESQKGEVVCSVNEEGQQGCPFVVVQLLSHVLLFDTPWTAASQASLSSTIIRSLLQPLSIESVMPSPLLLPLPLLSFAPCPLPLYQSTCDCPHA